MQQRMMICTWLSLLSTLTMNAHNCPHFGKALLEHAREKQNSEISSKKVAQNEQKSTGSLPDSFGKTHFIVGASTDQIKKEFKQGLPSDPAPRAVSAAQENFDAKAFFSPDDGLEKKLIELIENEQDTIKIAVFLFTNGNIAQALMRARKRGIKIELVTDSSCLQDKFNKIAMLHAAGIKIYIYKPETAAMVLSNRMHHKYIVFGKNKDGKSWLWFGSFNLTKSADLYNQEGVILVDNSQLINQFSKQFDILKKRSISYQEAIPAGSMTMVAAKNCRHLKKMPKKISGLSRPCAMSV